MALKKKVKEAENVGYLGVTMQTLTDDIIDGLDLKIKRGVLISEVMDDSPAEEAGLKDGDVIISYDGNKIASTKELSKLVRATSPGDEIKLRIIRDDDTKTLTAVIGEKPEEFAWTFKNDGERVKDVFVKMFRPGVQLGVRIQDLDNEDFASYFDVTEGEGVLVMGVDEESAAEEAGVRAGDVIISLNDDDVTSSEELIEAVQEMEEGDEFELVVKRRGRNKVLTGTMKEGKGIQHMHYSGDMPRFFKNKDLSLHMDGKHWEGFTDKLKGFKLHCEGRCEHDDDEACTDECKKLFIYRDHMGNVKDKLKKVDRHIILKDDDLKAELKELKEELRKLKKRLEKIEE